MEPTRHHRARVALVALAIALAAAAVGAGVVSASTGTNTSVLIGQGQAVHSADLQLIGGTDVVVAQNTFTPGATSGWHSHPGPAIVVVQSGEITIYQERTAGGRCRHHTYTAGQSFIEWPANSQTGVNHGTVDTVVAVTFLKVPHLGSARIDRPDPGNC